MNREKGLFRLAVVLAPVFGIVAIVLNNLLVLDLDNIGANYMDEKSLPLWKSNNG
jgi:hypothetical protein